MTKLSDAELVILNQAAQRDDHAIAMVDRKKTTRETIEGLIAKKLLKTGPRKNGEAPWGRDAERVVLGVSLTAKGLKALGIDEPLSAEGGQEGIEPTKPAKPTKSNSPSKSKTPRSSKVETTSADEGEMTARRGGSKLASVIALLRRDGGATVAELMAATGWQAHSVRGAISGVLKKKQGLLITSQKTGEVRRYGIAG